MPHGSRSSRMTKEEKDFQAESDLRTLQEADEIRRNKARLNRAKKKAKEMMEALKKV